MFNRYLMCKIAILVLLIGFSLPACTRTGSQNHQQVSATPDVPTPDTLKPDTLKEEVVWIPVTTENPAPVISTDYKLNNYKTPYNKLARLTGWVRSTEYFQPDQK